MAAIVRNGSGNLTYTNDTGGNVRVIIYYMSPYSTGSDYRIAVTSDFGTSSISYSSSNFGIGKDIAGGTAIAPGGTSSQNISGNFTASAGIPTQIMLANGQSLSALCGGYNVVIIPENG